MTLSVTFAPGNSDSANLSTMPNITGVRDYLIRKWRVIVSDTVIIMLNVLWTSEISRWPTLISQERSRTSTLTTHGPTQQSKTHIVLPHTRTPYFNRNQDHIVPNLE